MPCSHQSYKAEAIRERQELYLRLGGGAGTRLARMEAKPCRGEMPSVSPEARALRLAAPRPMAAEGSGSQGKCPGDTTGGAWEESDSKRSSDRPAGELWGGASEEAQSCGGGWGELGRSGVGLDPNWSRRRQGIRGGGNSRTNRPSWIGQVNQWQGRHRIGLLRGWRGRGNWSYKKRVVRQASEETRGIATPLVWRKANFRKLH